MTLATLFFHPILLPWRHCLWYMIPLCLVVAVVYKAVRVKHLSQLPKESGILMAYLLFGLSALGVGLWASWELFH